VEKAGGVLNANTTGDRTYYYEVLPSNQLELGLWLESERMLHARVDEKGITTQREVVKEERRQRYENQPYGSILPEVLKRAYSQHPYQWPTIGLHGRPRFRVGSRFQNLLQDVLCAQQRRAGAGGRF
jgi:predicted Zn-dependent peptidase